MTYHADLHLHSSYSDGLLPPRELVARVQAAGLKAFSLTDHDTLAGIPEAGREAEKLGLGFVPGVELSLSWKGAPLHLLVYGNLEESQEIEAVLRVSGARNRRFIRAFCASLTARGVPAHEDELKALPTRRAFHALKVLTLSTRKKDARAVWKEARLEAGSQLGPRLDVGRVLPVLQGKGFASSWAHPLADEKQPQLISTLDVLVPLGLSALEVHHGRHPASAREKLGLLAKERRLRISGGSDCHFRPGWPSLGDGGLAESEYRKLIETLSLGERAG